MPASPRLALPLIAAGQSQKDVTHNEALLALDRLVALAVASRSRAAPPSDPVPGELHIVSSAAAAAWGHPAGTLVQWQNPGWLALAPPDGQIALLLDENLVLIRHGSWQSLWPVAGLAIAGRQVLAAPPASIAAPSGGGTVDGEARATIAALITALQQQGILAV